MRYAIAAANGAFIAVLGSLAGFPIWGTLVAVVVSAVLMIGYREVP